MMVLRKRPRRQTWNEEHGNVSTRVEQHDMRGQRMRACLELDGLRARDYVRIGEHVLGRVPESAALDAALA